MEVNTLIELLKSNDITIYSPSYNRQGKIITHRMLPTVQYVVSEEQAGDYRKQNPDCFFKVAPNSAQGNLCRIRNWILDHAETKNVLIVDDDFKGLGRWSWDDEGNKTHQELDTQQIYNFIEHGFLLAQDMDVKMWGVNCVGDPISFRDYIPFKLTAYIGGPWQAFCNMDLRYDTDLPLKEDYDMTLQVLNKYRRILRFNAYHYSVFQCENEGGCATYRTIEREKEQLALLQKKWGSKIVKIDEGNSQVKRKKQKNYDINPIIKIPIRGV